MAVLAHCLVLLLVLCALSPKVTLAIHGGQNATEDEFPSQVLITSHFADKYPDYIFICGGSIISSKWILTAASCVYGSWRAEVSAGSHDRNKPWGPGQVRAERIIVHEEYGVYGDYNVTDDIALVEVELPLDGWKMAAVRLAQYSFQLETRGIVVGWGYTDESKKTNILQKLQVNIRQYCANHQKATGFVAVSGGLCDGDTGGPLLIDGELHGVAATASRQEGQKCDKVDQYVRYMRLDFYRSWINEHTGISIDG